MQIFDTREFDAHEQVVFGHDARTGLRAIVAIHSTTLGPAAGGCRMWPYATTAEAVADVLRLSRGMSYKNAMAELPFGGGKAVIVGDSRKAKSTELFEAFGRLVESLGGRYVTAEVHPERGFGARVAARLPGCSPEAGHVARGPRDARHVGGRRADVLGGNVTAPERLDQPAKGLEELGALGLA